MERDFMNGFMPSYMDYNMSNNLSPEMNDPLFNPMFQYEQGYYYYRYLCMQMDYKIRCKEYEKMCKNDKEAIK